ncbi:hypothetical protein C1646_662025 [Rhizophagus diaphanus]|nr:hypothetical protein C1646_662025 [Rhizophagus diaphanus] [Rhizophagus sp. MUCL 43196]
MSDIDADNSGMNKKAARHGRMNNEYFGSPFTCDPKCKADKSKPIHLKSEKIAKKGSEDSETSVNSNDRMIQIIDISVYRQVKEIRESFEDIDEIEKIYTRGAEKNLLTAQKMKIKFKKSNTTCTNKDINKSPTKKFVSGADNWKNLKKSYADAAKTRQKYKNDKEVFISQSHDQTYQHKDKRIVEDEDKEDFNQHPFFLKFKEQIINTICQVKEKLFKTESLISSTSKQISEIVTAQQALKCDKAHSILVNKLKKKKNIEEIDMQVKRKKVNVKVNQSPLMKIQNCR